MFVVPLPIEQATDPTGVAAGRVGQGEKELTDLDKLVDLDDSVVDLPHGATVAVGGCGLCGIPPALIGAVHRRGTTDLRVISNNCGVDDWGWASCPVQGGSPG